MLVLGSLFGSFTYCLIKPITALDVNSEGSPENLYEGAEKLTRNTCFKLLRDVKLDGIEQ